jgi:hypothetical protein
MKMSRKGRRNRRGSRINDVYRRLSLYCPHHLFKELKGIAGENRCSLEFVLRDALEHYVDVVSFTALENSLFAEDGASRYNPAKDSQNVTGDLPKAGRMSRFRHR